MQVGRDKCGSCGMPECECGTNLQLRTIGQITEKNRKRLARKAEQRRKQGLRAQEE